MNGKQVISPAKQMLQIGAAGMGIGLAIAVGAAPPWTESWNPHDFWMVCVGTGTIPLALVSVGLFELWLERRGEATLGPGMIMWTRNHLKAMSDKDFELRVARERIKELEAMMDKDDKFLNRLLRTPSPHEVDPDFGHVGRPEGKSSYE